MLYEYNISCAKSRFRGSLALFTLKFRPGLSAPCRPYTGRVGRPALRGCSAGTGLPAERPETSFPVWENNIIAFFVILEQKYPARVGMDVRPFFLGSPQSDCRIEPVPHS